ncbi:MAG: hemerythrin family protein [Deltaproteobacteria bacterium]|nr:hemerythrin family protein [Deltaproteobacteria bacterium]
MALLRWNSEFELGISLVDEQHRYLVLLLNKVYRDFNKGMLNDSLARVLDELSDYATYHFFAEERWMAEHQYPRLVDHRCEHDYFKQRIKEIQRDFARGNRVALEVLILMNDWVMNHIFNSDADCGCFIQ